MLYLQLVSVPEATLLCKYCQRAYHLACLHLDAMSKGFWYCPTCTDHILAGRALSDLTLNLLLVAYMFRNKPPSDRKTHNHAVHAAKFLQVK